MPQTVLSHQLANGLVLVVEPMDWLDSAAFALLLPAGCKYDPPERLGLASFTCEMVQRGCGSRSSRQFIEDLENLGVDRSASVSNAHTSFGGAMPAERIGDALSIYADLVQRPHLPDQQLEDARMVCWQEVRAIEDDLGQRVMQELRQRYYADPFGRASQGTLEAVEAITLDDIRAHFEATYRPEGAILSVAGNVDWPRLRDEVESLFGSWRPGPSPGLSERPPARGYLHIPHESAQTHVAVAYANVPYSDPDYYQARGAVGVLSDGMSSRLFTEVREKRGLCYTVYASCHSLRDRGAVICYSGTTTERAQETLDVMLAELQRLSQGILPDELARLKARIKSALIMQQESSASRSGSIASDWYFLNRVQTLEQLGRIIDGLSCESINAYLAAHPPADFTVVTLGEKELELPVGISPQDAG